MPTLVVAGAQWGDEGKGKVVDLLARDADLVVRFQGGPNAGHTLVVGGRTTVLHHLPSGILNPSAVNVLGPGVVVDPVTCLEEITSLRERGEGDLERRLVIDRGCHLILPVHRQLDRAREAAASAGGRIGTTGRGIGPCWEDLVARRGWRIGHPEDAERLPASLREKAAILRELGERPPSLDECLGPVLAALEALRPFVGDGLGVVRDALAGGARVLFEGAQGTFLDPLHGTYPFVTSSPCVAPAAAWGAGAPAAARGAVLGVTKAYATRVGGGPFPTELHGPSGDRLREAGAEYGATTGRPRRCGWQDLHLLRRAVALNGFTALAVTKLDVLSGMGPLALASEARDAAGDPRYEELPGWDAAEAPAVAGARSLDALPPAAAAYVRRIEAGAGVPVSVVSVGSERERTVLVSDPWSA